MNIPIPFSGVKLHKTKPFEPFIHIPITLDQEDVEGFTDYNFDIGGRNKAYGENGKVKLTLGINLTEDAFGAKAIPGHPDSTANSFSQIRGNIITVPPNLAVRILEKAFEQLPAQAKPKVEAWLSRNKEL